MTRSLTVTWHDPLLLAEQARTLPGIEFLRALRDGDIAPPPIAELLGMRLTQVEAGRAVFEITPAEQHYNPIGVVHGGLAMTLLDSAMGCAVHSLLAAHSTYTTLEVKANLVRPVTSKTGKLRAIANVVHCGKRIATAEARLEDASGKLYAHASTTCIILGNGS
jgi:uncharacterized protein (TIGR00369 family)